MIKKCFTLLIFSFFFIAVVFTSGCPSPIGSLQVDSDTVVLAAALDYIRAEPLRSLYDQNNTFKPADPDEGVHVYGIFGGVEDPNPIDIDKLEFIIIDDPGLITAKPNPVTDKQEGLQLTTKGVKTVVISYIEMKTSYPIVVGEKGSSGWIHQGGSGAGITIIWK